MTAHATPLLDAAREWYDAGYCVVPSHEDGGKRPFGKWKDYQQQRPEWAQVQTWLATGRYTGIGVLTGAASGNVEMVEIEGPVDAAIERLQRVFEQARTYSEIGIPDLLANVARGCVEQSAGGGLHLFIRVSDGPALGNTRLANRDGKVVAETRGEGGFVIVAPTPGRNGHDAGTSYLFINGGHPRNTVTVTSEERDLLHLLFTLALDDGDLTDPDPDTPTRPRQPGTETVIRDIPQPGGTTFDRYRNAVTWAELLTPLGWTHHHRDQDGRDHWTRPGKTTHEGTSATTYEDGPLYVFSSNAGLPTYIGLSKPQAFAHLHHHGDMSAAARALKDRGYGEDTYAPLQPFIVTDPETGEQTETTWVKEHLPLVDWHQLWGDQTQEEWLVEPLLAARRLVALYSAPKVGKSLLMLEIAAGLAAGRSVLGNKPRDPVRVLYVDFENDPRGDVRRRLEDMAYGPQDLERLCYLTFPVLDALDSEKGSQQLAAAVDEYECTVVVVDTISRAVEGEENVNDTWLNFYRHTGLKMKQRGVALIRLDHSGKDDSKGMRGGSAKYGDVDAVWKMTRTSDTLYELVCDAKRFPIAEESLLISREESPLRHVVRGDGALERLREEVMEWMSQAGVPKDGSMTLSEVQAVLRSAGHKFRNGVVNGAVYEQYLKRPAIWRPDPLPGDASE